MGPMGPGWLETGGRGTSAGPCAAGVSSCCTVFVPGTGPCLRAHLRAGPFTWCLPTSKAALAPWGETWCRCCPFWLLRLCLWRTRLPRGALGEWGRQLESAFLSARANASGLSSLLDVGPRCQCLVETCGKSFAKESCLDPSRDPLQEQLGSTLSLA